MHLYLPIRLVVISAARKVFEALIAAGEWNSSRIDESRETSAVIHENVEEKVLYFVTAKF